MALSILELTNHCCSPKLNKACDSKKNLKILIADTLVWVTALVVSILGLTNIISMPTAAAYGILALPCTMLPLFIVSMIKSKHCSSQDYHAKQGAQIYSK